MSPAQVADKITDKIKKLLKLAKGNTTEGEASAAMQKVQDLLADYNLTMAQVEAKADKSDKVADDPEANRTKQKHEKSAMYKFQRNLMQVIADCNFCHYWTGEAGKYTKNGRWMRTYHHVLVGREANVMVAQNLFDYLNTTIERLCNEKYPSPLNLSKSAISFKEGCAVRLQERLRVQRREADAASTAKTAEAAATGSALMLLTDLRQNEKDLNYDFACGFEPGTTAKNRADWLVRQAEPQAEVTETEEERIAREKRNKKFWERYDRERQREHDAKDWNAFYAGKEKGNTVGLDTQVH